MTIDSNGLITWDNPILGNHSIAIKVTDNAGNLAGDKVLLVQPGQSFAIMVKEKK
jgi:hypothetical protein